MREQMKKEYGAQRILLSHGYTEKNKSYITKYLLTIVFAALRHLSEQYSTFIQSRSHFFLHVNDSLQIGHTFRGRSLFFI